MPIQRLNEFPSASGSNLTSDDVFIFMDDPSGLAVTKKIALSELSSSIGGGGPKVVQLGSVSGVINTDASLGNIFDLTIINSGVIVSPINPTDGQSIRWRIRHQNVNTFISLSGVFRIPSSATNPLPFSTSSNRVDLLAATYDQDRNVWDVISFVPGYTP